MKPRTNCQKRFSEKKIHDDESQVLWWQLSNATVLTSIVTHNSQTHNSHIVAQDMGEQQDIEKSVDGLERTFHHAFQAVDLELDGRRVMVNQ